MAQVPNVQRILQLLIGVSLICGAIVGGYMIYCQAGDANARWYGSLRSLYIDPHNHHSIIQTCNQSTFDLQSSNNYFNVTVCNNQTVSVPYKTWTQGVVQVLEPVVPKNCSLLFAGDKQEIERVQAALVVSGKLNVYSMSECYLKSLKSNCSYVENEFFAFNFYTSKVEIDFPLAFAFVIHENPQQVMRLLKVLYRPHNVYCVHVDRKASNFTRQFIEQISKCIPNILVSTRSESVFWGHHTLLDAELDCFSDLYNVRKQFPWKYAMTLSGKELPLRTNREIVGILKQLDGNTAIKLAYGTPKLTSFEQEPQIVLDETNKKIQTVHNKIMGPPPHNLTIYKSMIFFALAMEFVEFMVNSEIAKDFRGYMQNAFAPEEKFYATLFMMPGVPKGFNKSVSALIPDFTRYTWLTETAIGKNGNWRHHCYSGLNVHSICIIGVEDMFRLNHTMKVKPNEPITRGPMFHNKYFMEVDHVVMDCCEEELVQRNINEFKTDQYMSTCHDTV